MYAIFDRVKSFLWEVTKILGLVVAVSIFVSILFGPEAPFFGAALTNLKPVIDSGQAKDIEHMWNHDDGA